MAGGLKSGVRRRAGPLAHSVHSGESGFAPPLPAEPQPGGWSCASYLEIVFLVAPSHEHGRGPRGRHGNCHCAFQLHRSRPMVFKIVRSLGRLRESRSLRQNSCQRHNPVAPGPKSSENLLFEQVELSCASRCHRKFWVYRPIDDGFLGPNPNPPNQCKEKSDLVNFR